jgi:glycosyltransferase involved in cell wall biosynthesis
VRILSVGRTVEKKGYHGLLEALAALPRDLHWRFRHVGGGPLSETLSQHAAALGLEERIEWLGARSQETVVEQYREADLFVLGSRVAADGDRDGLPNVLVEAQTLGLACVATTVGGIPELIDHGATGLLVAPDDHVALAAALQTMIGDPNRRADLAQAGMTRVGENFSFAKGIDRLAEKFGLDRSEENVGLEDEPAHTTGGG